MSGRPIKRTLRGRRARVRRLSRHSRTVRQLHALLMPSRQLRGGLPAHGTRRSNDVGFLRIRHPQVISKGVDDTPQRLARVGSPENLSGLSALDFGAWDGFFSFDIWEIADYNTQV